MIRYRIAIVGAGGTGSHFIARFSQFLASYQSEHILYDVVVIDGDTVEDGNLARQVFVAGDVMQNKAVSMVEAVYETYGLNFTAYPHYLDTVEDLQKAFSCLENSSWTNGKKVSNIPVVIGCCDNHRCRQVMEKFFETSPDAIYIDAANEFSIGEVVFSLKFKNQVVAPPRSFYFPEVLRARGKRKSEESCGAVNKSSPQHIATNMEAANIMLSWICQLFTGDGSVSGGIVYFDTFNFTKVYRKYERVAGGEQNV